MTHNYTEHLGTKYSEQSSINLEYVSILPIKENFVLVSKAYTPGSEHLGHLFVDSALYFSNLSPPIWTPALPTQTIPEKREGHPGYLGLHVIGNAQRVRNEKIGNPSLSGVGGLFTCGVLCWSDICRDDLNLTKQLSRFEMRSLIDTAHESIINGPLPMVFFVWSRSL